VQFTPDLMPSDILGSEILQEDPETRQRSFKFAKGPVFTNMLLADEINRTPPKTQAALLEAMQERHVSTGEQEFELEPPFFVLATQNPVEQEGTYPLPEAQLDRFLCKILVDYPTKDQEMKIVQQASSGALDDVEPVLEKERVIAAQQAVRRIVVAERVVAYATDLVRTTRVKTDESPQFIKELLSWGAGPRASISMISAAKVRAALNGRYHAAIEDVQAVAKPILRHRIIPNFTAQAKGLDSDLIIDQILEATPVAGGQ
jgi:MoxR-like ATPase